MPPGGWEPSCRTWQKKSSGRHAQKIQVVLQSNEQDLKRNAEGRTARVIETSSKTGSVLRYS